MTDWAKIIAETVVPEGVTPEDILKQALSDAPLPSAARFAELRALMGANFIGPEEVMRALNVKELGGGIPALPSGLIEFLKSDSLITPGAKVAKDHTLMIMPTSFDGVENSVWNLKGLVEQAEAKRKLGQAEHEQVGPIFYQGQDWYHKGQEKEERWAQAPLKEAYWVLVANTVPEDTRGIDYTSQSKIIAANYQDYKRGSAHELIQLLSLSELLSSERRYPSDTWGWTETETDKAGAFPGRRVFVGCFSAGGFWVVNVQPGFSDASLGAFLRRNF